MSLLLEAKDRNGHRPAHRAAETDAVAARKPIVTLVFYSAFNGGKVYV